MTKKRNKKYNPVESARKINMALLKNTAVSFITKDVNAIDPCKLITLTGNEIEVTNNIYNALAAFRYKWSVMITVFCIEKNKNTCKMEIVNFTTPYLQSELVEFLNDKHQAYIKKFQKLNVHIVGAGWLASPVGHDFETEEVGYIFNKLKAWG